MRHLLLFLFSFFFSQKGLKKKNDTEGQPGSDGNGMGSKEKVAKLASTQN